MVEEGTRIGSWVIGEKLGAGGMGEVYLARHAMLGTPAAVKALSPLMTQDADTRERFFREAKLQSGLVHPHIAQVKDFLEAQGQFFLVQEYLEGGSLADALRAARGALPPARVLAWARQALGALDYAHRCGVVHRDIKPSNIMLDRHGAAKVLDFGIAKVVGGDAQRTSTGAVIGTPSYMSPEQIMSSRDVDHTTDQYAMGIVLFELLTGSRPFGGETEFAVMMSHVSGEPPAPRTVNPSIAPGIEAAILRALAKEPAGRFDSCAAFAAALGGEAPGEAPDAADDRTLRAAVVPPAAAVSTKAATEMQPSVPRPVSHGLRSSRAPAGRSRALAVVAGAAAVVAAVAVTAVVFLTVGRGKGEGRDAPPAPAAQKAAPAPVSAPAPVPAAAGKLVELKSDPPGADVLVDGKPVCRTPCAHAFTDRPGPYRIELVKEDFAPRLFEKVPFAGLASIDVRLDTAE